MKRHHFEKGFVHARPLICSTYRTATRFCALLLCLLLLLPVSFSCTALAADWPQTELNAGTAAVVDADTGAVLFSKNQDQAAYPASITKVMTALVVLENCKLDEEVTFSHDAVYNVDKGSSNAQIEAGDVLTVEDCLYALLLKSANESANALAEHVAGSREAFAELMNQKAAELGCTNTHFTNPSGLFDANHYTTARDMTRIGIAAMNNAEFLKIESSTSHRLAPGQRVPEGNVVYMEHKMLLPNSRYYDSRVIAGKTGYTLDAGNTLITMAEQDGRRLVAVVMQDKNPAHYTDTKLLLDLGFNETENQTVGEGIVDLSALCERLIADTIVPEGTKSAELLLPTAEQLVSLPIGASQEGLSYTLEYNLPRDAPKQAVAELSYTMDGRTVGQSYVEKEPSIQVMLDEVPTQTKVAVAVTVSGFTVAAIAAFVIFGGGAAIGAKNIHDDRKLRRKMKEKRLARLQELEMSEEEFRELVEKKKAERSRKQK